MGLSEAVSPHEEKTGQRRGLSGGRSFDPDPRRRKRHQHLGRALRRGPQGGFGGTASRRPKKLAKKNSFGQIIEVIKAIRTTRANYQIPDNKKITINIFPNEKIALIRENREIINKLAGGSEVKIVKKEMEKSAKIITKLCTISSVP